MADDWNPPDYEDVPELDVADVDRLHATLDELSERSVLGDAGACALFQRMSPVEETNEIILKELKLFTLSNNELGEASVAALAGAIGGGALRGCKKLALDGNPASKATVKAVGKALKKNK